MPIKRRTTTNIHEDALAASTPIQAETLEKMLGMNWTITQVFTRAGKSAIALSSKNTNCWLLPDGKVIRPKHGQGRAELDIKLLS